MAIPRQLSGALLTQEPYAGPQIWGTGVNPIHATRDGQGRNIAPYGVGNLVPEELTDQTDPYTYGYQDEDNIPYSVELAMEPNETGMGDRPSWSVSPEGVRAQTTPGYPSPGELPSGRANGENIRAQEHGAIAGNIVIGVPAKSAAAGYESKLTDGVIQPGSGISSPNQYTMQTSMQQLHRTRAGSQSSGTASVYTQPITTRVPGQRVAGYSGGYRHQEMMPRQQSGIPWRAFFLRTAGTGKLLDLKPNVPLNNSPMQRVPPPDPDQGPAVGNTAGAEQYGYTGEDVVW